MRAWRFFSCVLPFLMLWASAAPTRAVGLESVIARVKPSIVAVGTFEATRNPRFVFRGTGFVIGDGNLVATNNHVLPESLDEQKRERIVIVLPPVADQRSPEPRDARVVATDRDHDVALLRISGTPLPSLHLASADASDGQEAMFTGFPIGSVLGLIPVTHRAFVSAITPIAIPAEAARQLTDPLRRRLDAGPFNVLQLDATAYPGNSGSPLYDAATGDVLGIVNMVFVKTTKEAVLSQPSGITFAVPARYIQDLLKTVQSK